MPRHKYHRDRVYQLMCEPGPGSIAVGYVRYSSEMQDPASIVTQKRVISEFADKKGWRIVRWYVEPEQSAKYEDADERPVFAQMLRDGEAGAFQVALCYANNRWSRNTALTFLSLSHLRRARVWWATADGLWDIDRIQQNGHGIAFTVDTQMNEAYLRQHSKRTIDGKEDRAREVYTLYS
jgi:DNA invertase Pin-like site-specific DNA recombinase